MEEITLIKVLFIFPSKQINFGDEKTTRIKFNT